MLSHTQKYITDVHKLLLKTSFFSDCFEVTMPNPKNHVLPVRRTRRFFLVKTEQTSALKFP